MIKLLLALFTLLFLTACVHDISVSPELSKIKKIRPVTIHSTVAYYIPPERYLLSVTTPGGNNDDLRYAPYKETESSLKKVLDNVFTEVHKIAALDDPKIKEDSIQFIFIPTIETMSFSNSNVDWQPTKFNMILKVHVLNAEKKELFTTYAEGKGIANFGRYQKNPTYAVEIASRSAFLQFQDEIITKRAQLK
ncbi:MAG: hypothetical protein PF439_00915 [Helicobacteraceae bacterium]|jgi:hypothetical protein|nr:hypothetical protein [Helicobacteraceae bacterium]